MIASYLCKNNTAFLFYRYNGERLQPPGEPKQLIDIAEEDYLEKDDKDFAHLLAER